MDSLLKADVFFFVTTVAILILSVFVIVILIYILKIVRNLRDISEVVKNESKAIADDISSTRNRIKSEGFKLSYLSAILSRFMGRRKRSSKSQKKTNEE